jgi:hypothetical protein
MATAQRSPSFHLSKADALIERLLPLAQDSVGTVAQIWIGADKCSRAAEPDLVEVTALLEAELRQARAELIAEAV